MKHGARHWLLSNPWREDERDCSSPHTCNALVYNFLKMKILHSYLHKKVVKRSIRRYREIQENLVRLLYPQGVLDQKIRVVQTKLISPT